MKVVINKGEGVFQLSDIAFEKLIEKGWKTTKVGINGEPEDSTAKIIDRSESNIYAYVYGKYEFVDRYDKEIRTHPDVIKVVEELGEKANGYLNKLEIINVDDYISWEIFNENGIEFIVELNKI
jgi:hypothetical protein